MIEYHFKDVECNEEPSWGDYDLNAEIEHIWWLDNGVNDAITTGKELFQDENTLIIPSYTYNTIYVNCSGGGFKDWVESRDRDIFRDIAQMGFYQTCLKCIIGIHSKEMGSIVQFLEVYEVNSCPTLLTTNIKKVYIVKIHLSKIETKGKLNLLLKMKKEITVNDDHAIFGVYENCMACTPTDCPFFANAFEYGIKSKDVINYDKKDVSFIAITDDDIIMSYTAKVLPNLYYNGFMSKLKSVLKGIE